MDAGDATDVYGLPPRYRDRTLESYDPGVSSAARAALDVTREAIRTAANLVLCGGPGAGKTHLVAGGARLWPVGGAMWCTVPEFIYRCRSDVGENTGASSRWLDEMSDHKGLLVLDDLGRERTTDFVTERLFLLINRRYEWGARTWATSNMRIAELEANGYGPMLSRLSEDGRLLELATAVDYRTRRISA